jgi:polysaccharide biosynthesis transport protein
MSRNFEVLSRIEQEQGALVIDSPLSLASVAEKGRSKATCCHADNGGRTEILKLVHALFLSGTNAPRQVLFCGVGDSDGSGNVCVSAAKVLANEVSSRVCVVDAKVRAPSLHGWLEPEGSVFTPSNQVLRGSVAREIARNLWFVPAECLGPTGTGAEQLCSTIRELRDEFDYVLIDAPPVGRYTDAAVLGRVTDGVVLVVEANATRRVAARNAKETLQAVNVRLLGTVLNNRTFPIPEKIYRRL